MANSQKVAGGRGSCRYLDLGGFSIHSTLSSHQTTLQCTLNSIVKYLGSCGRYLDVGVFGKACLSILRIHLTRNHCSGGYLDVVTLSSHTSKYTLDSIVDSIQVAYFLKVQNGYFLTLVNLKSKSDQQKIISFPFQTDGKLQENW